MLTKEIFFKDADEKIYPVRLPHIDANFATSKFPWEWSADEKKFAKRPASKEKGDPLGPDAIVGMTGGDPTKTDRLGVFGPASVS